MINRREMLCAAAAVGVGVLLSPFTGFVWAADPVEVPVTVTKKDGTAVKGKINDFDRDGLTIKPAIKPKEPEAAMQSIPWSDIAKVSNGLTYAKALQNWKGRHQHVVCDTCHGDGTTFCPKCHGTRHDPAASAKCDVCKGEAHLKCTTAKCDKGNLPCPNPSCLKLTDGGWYVKKDGNEKWKKFPTAGGYAEWSEHHCGQVIQRVNGSWQNIGDCPVCGGKSMVDDPVCKCTGDMPCPKCSKNTLAAACPDKCNAGLVQCPVCKGSGVKT